MHGRARRRATLHRRRRCRPHHSLPDGSAPAAWRRGSPLAVGLIHAAQMLNAAAGPLVMSGPTTVSSLYFPPHQRGLATAVAYCGGSVAMLLAFMLGPLVLHDHSSHVPSLLLIEVRRQRSDLGASASAPLPLRTTRVRVASRA